MAFLKTEFRPRFALCDAGVDIFFYNGGTNPAHGFDTLAVVIEAVGYYRFGAVFIGGYDLWGKGCGVVKFLVVGPVRAAELRISISDWFQDDEEPTLLSSTWSQYVSQNRGNGLQDGL